MKNLINNYTMEFSNFYYKSNSKHIDDYYGESDNVNELNLCHTDTIILEKENIDNINKICGTNYNETNSKEILEYYLDEFNVDDIDWKVELIEKRNV